MLMIIYHDKIFQEHFNGVMQTVQLAPKDYSRFISSIYKLHYITLSNTKIDFLRCFK